MGSTPVQGFLFFYVCGREKSCWKCSATVKVAERGFESMQQSSGFKTERKEKLEAAECRKRIGHSEYTQNIKRKRARANP